MAEGCAFHSKVHVLPNPTLDRSEPSPSHTRPAFRRHHSSMTVSDEVLRRHSLCEAVLYELDEPGVPAGHCDCPACRETNTAALIASGGVARLFSLDGRPGFAVDV